MTPEKCCSTFESMMSKHLLPIKFASTSCYITLGWMPQNNSYDGLMPLDNNPLPSPMLIRCMSPYGVTRPKWVKLNIKRIRTLYAKMPKRDLNLQSIKSYIAILAATNVNYGIYLSIDNTYWKCAVCIQTPHLSSLTKWTWTASSFPFLAPLIDGGGLEHPMK